MDFSHQISYEETKEIAYTAFFRQSESEWFEIFVRHVEYLIKEADITQSEYSLGLSKDEV